MASEYALRAELTVHERTVLRAAIEHGDRKFRRDPLVISSPIGSDKYTNLGAGVVRAIGRRVNLTADVRQVYRRTDSGSGDFDATLVTLGASLRF